jgi:hypothetical protein
MDVGEYRRLMAMRVAAGKQIDPETAEICWRHACMFDPYGDDPNLPEELQIVGREYFVRGPGAEIWMWVHINDLPETARDIILQRLHPRRNDHIDTEVVAAIRRDLDSN